MAVTIGGSDYVSLSIPDQLEFMMDNLIQNYNTIKNLSNKALYIHNNIGYLQYFQDCNKRLARILQSLSLLHDKKLLFTFTSATLETIEGYKKSLIIYYDKGSILEPKEYFVEQYQKGLELTYYLKLELKSK
ncbi:MULTISPECIES: Fic family protein [unclassified Helicobacter]|uniref:Fic family protein n=1 Tax=unclassified Helicobacter TaxID=2593540 RepID=UPI000CF06790|nr:MULTISPECIES: Fic family protein [unclassified Helicobacter]